MNNYCTLFDSHYLTRALAMYRSIINTGEEFKLYMYCFDDLAYDLLNKLSLINVNLIKLSDFETHDLLKVKSDRTRAEYCWTCTPFVIRHSLDRFKLEEVTYLDADLYFFNKPDILLDEFHQSKKSVMITEHRYTPVYDISDVSGIYCVQFMTFKADKYGLRVLQWWQERCLEWCYNRVEDGKFGDQKYLDEWPIKFEGVHVLQHLGGGVAPWNVQQYKIDKGPLVNGIPIVFYHFHALRWYSKNIFYFSEYILSDNVKKNIYYMYVESLKKELCFIKSIDKSFKRGILSYRLLLKEIIILFIRVLKRNFKIVKM